MRRSTYVKLGKPIAAILFWAWFKKPHTPAARLVRKIVYRLIHRKFKQIGK